MRRIISSKKGESGDWGVEEVAKTLVSILGIIIIALLLGNLFGIFTNKNDQKKAESALEDLYGQISQLKEGEVGSSLLQGPKNWRFVYLNPENFYYSKPPVCVGKHCLCLCPFEGDEDTDWHGSSKACVDEGGACKEFETPLGADFVSVMGSLNYCERITPGEIDGTFNRCLKMMSVNEYLDLEELPQVISFRKEGKVFLTDWEQGSKITSNFLNKTIGDLKMKEFLADKIFKGCENWDPSLDDLDKKSLETASKEYIDSLIREGKLKGGIIVFTSQRDNVRNDYAGRISNLLLVKQGKTSSCLVIEEKIICKKSMESDNSEYSRNVRGYVRMYTCS